MDSTDETLPGSVPMSNAFSLERGDLVDRYVVVEKVGMGGMGAAYSAYDPDLDRRIAIKVLHAAEGPTDSSSATQRLLREAQAMAKLSHPNVVSVLDVGRHQGEVFVAMEFVDGDTLADWLPKTKPPVDEILRVFIDAAHGLEAAHEAGLVHRDFKPSNVMLDQRGRVFVMDLGLARLPGKGSKPPIELLEAATAETTVEDLTRTGALMGTPAYMSPEQYLGLEVTSKSDQFSFFVALYEALYGQRPFRGDSPAALAFNVTQGELDAPTSKSGVSTRVHRAIVRGLDVDPAKRFADMREVREALTPKQSRIFPIAASIGTLALLIGGLIASGDEADNPVCAGAADAIAQVWTDEGREKIRSAFEATELEHAGDVAERTIAALNEHASTWMEVRTGACEATHVFKEQSEEVLDLRIACLDDRHREFTALVEVLAEADDATIANAARATASLGSLDACSNVAQLKRGLVPPPEKAKQQVENARERLARARMLDEAGSYAKGLAIAEPLLEEALELEYVPLTVEVHNVLGALTSHLGDWAGAEEHYESAYFAAMGGVHPEAAAKAAVTLIKITGSPFAMGRREDGLRWNQHAEGAVRRLDDGGFLNAIRLDSLGHIQSLGGDTDRAVEYLEESVKTLEELRGESYHLINALNDYAYALEAKGRHEEAIAVLERNIEVEKNVVGEVHPLVGSTYGTLGAIYINMQRYEEGERATRHAMEVLSSSMGEDHPNLASMMVNLSDLYVNTDREAEAVPLIEKAVQIRSKAMGPGHPIYLWTLNFLAEAYLSQDRFDDSLATAERALREQGDLGDDHHHVRAARLARAKALIRLGRGAEVREDLERELAAVPDLKRPWLIATVRSITGQARIATGDRKSGVELLELARAELPEDEDYELTRKALDELLVEHSE